jgi:hypothetical protein
MYVQAWCVVHVICMYVCVCVYVVLFVVGRFERYEYERYLTSEYQ